jgi:hypothetical protein
MVYIVMVQCGKCFKEIDGTYGSGKFCSRSCANSRLVSEEQKKKVSEKLINVKNRITRNCLTCDKEIISTKKRNKKYCNSECANQRKMVSIDRRNAVDTIWSMSSRTRCKLLKRMGKGCCRCGWNEAACDLHHVKGRKITNPNADTNLTLLCPNCHRLFHSGKIGPNEVITLDVYLSNWKEYYFG